MQNIFKLSEPFSLYCFGILLILRGLNLGILKISAQHQCIDGEDAIVIDNWEIS
ncbi:MAG: hypothetical protein IPJ43_17950 [Saprospiraceae bacterium]|nr:hypothetical protein [Saprospiraceae bacterium]